MMELGPFARGQIFDIPSGNKKGSAEFYKERPYVISQEIPEGVRLTYIMMSPLSNDNGKLYPFQQRYKHDKPSKIHYENSRPIDVKLLKKYKGCLSEADLLVMEQCQIALWGLDSLTFTDICSLEVRKLESPDVEVVISYPKKERILEFSKQDFFKECIGHANCLQDKEKLEFYLSTFTGLQFLRKKGRLVCQNMSWTSSI